MPHERLGAGHADLAETLASLGAELDIDGLWTAYRADSIGDDAQDFIGWLHREGHIETRLFCGLLTSGTLLVGTSNSATWDPEAKDPSVGFPAEAPPRRYRFLGPVGKGAMGEVHVATDERLNRRVAIKQMSKRIASDPRQASRFFTEAQITAQLEHPNVVPIYSLEDIEGAPAYSMKLIHGRTFAEIIRETRELYDAGRSLDDEHSLPTRLDHFLKVCDAMHYAHERGVVHRDLKPANIMVGPYHEVYVMDWGIAKLIGAPEELDDATCAELLTIHDSIEVEKTQLGYAIGTPAYMAPEQAWGHNDKIDERSDVFSLGLVLYELVTLGRAYPGTGGMVLFRAQEGDIAPVKHYAASENISADLAAIIRRATTADHTKRYPSAEDLGDDLRRLLRGEPTHARPDNLFRTLSRRMSRHREASLLALLLLTLSTTTLIIGVLLYVQVSSAASQFREERLGYVLTEVGRQARDADLYFLRFQGLLEGLNGEAVGALTGPAPEPSIHYRNDDYRTDDQGASASGPPDLATVPRYGQPVSFDWPVFKLAPGVAEADVSEQLDRLITLRHRFRTQFLRSRSEDTTMLEPSVVDDLLGHQGVPLIWSYVSIEEGVHTSYPGHGGYPPEYDPRKRVWYELGRDSRGPQWGAPYIDVNGQGLILPCVMSLRDGEDRLLGVAGIELTFDLIIESLLRSPDLPGAEQAWLVDEQARVVVGSDDLGVEIGGGLHGNQGLDLEPLPLPAVVEAIAHGASGYYEADDDLVVYARLDSLGWTLVVTGPTEAMLARR